MRIVFNCPAVHLNTNSDPKALSKMKKQMIFSANQILMMEPKILYFIVLTKFLLKWPRDVTCDQKILCFFWYSPWNVINSNALVALENNAVFLELISFVTNLLFISSRNIFLSHKHLIPPDRVTLKMGRKSYFKGTYFRKMVWKEWRKSRKLLNQGCWNSNLKSIAGELEGLWWKEINPSIARLDSLQLLLITSLNGGHMMTSGRCVPKFLHERNS